MEFSERRLTVEGERQLELFVRPLSAGWKCVRGTCDRGHGGSTDYKFECNAVGRHAALPSFQIMRLDTTRRV
jgi:hypothetical protein